MGVEQADTDTPVSKRVLEAIAEAENTHVESLDSPLYESIDPEALDQLYAHKVTPNSVEFSCMGYLVQVDQVGTVTISEQDNTDREKAKK